MRSMASGDQETGEYLLSDLLFLMDFLYVYS